MSATDMIILSAVLSLTGIGCYVTAGAKWTAVTAVTFLAILGAMFLGKTVL